MKFIGILKSRRLSSGISLLMALAISCPVHAGTDYDGDNKDDVGVYQSYDGSWYIFNSSNSQMRVVNFGWFEARPVLGDYDGDGKDDLAAYVLHEGRWYILASSNNQLYNYKFGNFQEHPVPGDYDGDGRTDLAVYHRLTGMWSIVLSSNGQLIKTQFGWTDARPVPGDYDGDNKTDIAVYDRGSGNWFIRRSIDGQTTVRNWGYRKARPIPADYDGDNKTDIAVFEASSGNWFILQSSNDQLIQRNWGYLKTRPVPADYDGDGKDDIAIYERVRGDWYILQSSNNQLRKQNWGWAKSGALPSYRDGGVLGLYMLMFGDSITYGTDSSANGPTTGYPYLLERKVEPSQGGHFHSVNGGNPGETTAEGRTRLIAWLQQYKPDLTLIMEGTNDTFFNRPFSEIEANLRAMVNSAKAAGSDVIIATIPPVIKSAYRDRSAQMRLIQSFNPRIYDIGKTMGIRVAKVHEAITAVPNWQNLLMDQETANHPNDLGYRYVRDAFLEQVEAGIMDGQYY